MTLPTNALLNTTPPSANVGKGAAVTSEQASNAPSDGADDLFSTHFDEALQDQPDAVAQTIENDLEVFVAADVLDPLSPPLDSRQAVALGGNTLPLDKGVVPSQVARVTVIDAVAADEAPLVETDSLTRLTDQSVKRDQSMLEQGRNLALAFNNKGAESVLPVSSLTPETASSSLLTAQANNLLSPATPSATAPKLVSTLDVPFDDARWQNDFSQRVTWYAKAGVQSAEIKLNPAHLGPVEIRIEVNDEQASVTFYAKNSTTREALEASTARLREMLNDEGLDLTESFVSEHAFNEQNQDQAQGSQQDNELVAEGGGQDIEITPGSVLSPLSPARLLVDYYV